MSLYTFLYWPVQFILRLWHPVFRVEGRENLPAREPLVICANHSGMMDPAWLLFAMKQSRNCPVILAKESVLRIPVVGKVLARVGVVPVRRGENDVNAVKAGLSTLRSGRSLMLFPEGTRVRPGKNVEPKSGAVLFAHRTGTPILPIYLQAKRFPFSPLRCVIGAPWMPEAAGAKATPEELHSLTETLMKKIYALGGSET